MSETKLSSSVSSSNTLSPVTSSFSPSPLLSSNNNNTDNNNTVNNNIDNNNTVNNNTVNNNNRNSYWWFFNNSNNQAPEETGGLIINRLTLEPEKIIIKENKNININTNDDYNNVNVNNNNVKGNNNKNQQQKQQLPKDPKDQNSKVANEGTNSKDPSTKQDKILNSDQENQNYNNDLIENKRWSLFGTWSSPTPLENSTDKKSNDPSSTTTTTNTAIIKSTNVNNNDNNTSDDSINKDTQKASPPNSNNNNHHNKNKNNRINSSNPIVQTLPENSQSWLHFFTRMSLIENNPSSSRPHIGTTDKRRLIENGSLTAQTPSPATTTITTTTVSSTTKQATDEKAITTNQQQSQSQAQLQLVQAQTQIANSTTAVTGTTNSAITAILKPVPNNMVLPIFDDIARHKIRSCPTSMFQQTLHTINSYFFPLEKNNADGPFSKFFDEMTRSTIDVKRVAIIGVHGWFPAKLVRALVGEPTGTSQKFCDMMGKALLGYLSQHGIVLPEKAITCIPLEGEGTIEKREEILHQNLLNNKTWVEALSLADVIFVTTHSQGTPVSTILLAKLINEHRINPKRQRVCMLAMAGISHGPFPYLKESYIMKYIVGAGRGPESDAARELFEFMHPDSGVAIKYRNSLKLITNDGVKIVYVGSMDDQVVPLYSSLFTGVNHPSIIRAMYIHGPLYQANDFLANLLVFAVSLRNANINDHGLMVYLSEVVAGSLYSEGHSALYDEINVYTLAVKYLFETVKHPPKNVKLDLFRAQKQYNPFYLPWAMRGILEDKDVVRSESFSRDLHKLRKLFEEWEPTSKVMRDVKFRLEPLREFISRAKL